MTDEQTPTDGEAPKPLQDDADPEDLERGDYVGDDDDARDVIWADADHRPQCADPQCEEPSVPGSDRCEEHAR